MNKEWAKEILERAQQEAETTKRSKQMTEKPKWLVDFEAGKYDRENFAENDEFIRSLMKDHPEGEPYHATLEEGERFFRSNYFVAIQVFESVGPREEGCIGYMYDSVVFLKKEFHENWKHWIVVEGELRKGTARVLGPDEKRIAYVHVSGKWLEVWFDDEPYICFPERSYDECCKIYMMEELIDESLRLCMLNKGYAGMVVTWPKGSDRPTKIRAKEIGLCHT